MTAQPVRAADCVASIERWGKRDALGQKLLEAVDAMTADNDKTFTIKLKQPFPLLARRARQAVEQRAVHDAGADRQDRCRSSRSPRRSARARSSSSRRSGCPGNKVGVRQEHRLRAAQGAAEPGPPAARSPRSTASSGSTSPTPRPRRRRSTPARPIGASSRRPTSCRCFAANKDITVDDGRPARQRWACCASTTCCRRSTIRRCAQAVLNLVDQKDYMVGDRRRPENWKPCCRYLHLRHAVRDRGRRRAR